MEKVEDWLGIDNLYDPVNTPLVSFLNNSIKAKELYKRDKDYVVMNGEVLIVDEFTGRILHGRRYNEGMHQAIEAKEGVADPGREPDAGHDHAAELLPALRQAGRHDRHGHDRGERVPPDLQARRGADPDQHADDPGRPGRRRLPDRAGQVRGVRRATSSERHEAGQPVLVGTTSVEKSEILSKMLKRRGVPHEVLNAKYHEREAAIVAQAGRKGAVTVATNMAGRGTDIMLGGNPEFIADAELHQRGLSPVETPEDYEAAWPEAVEKAKRAVAEEHEEVVEAGGLYVLGTERHESRRIDNQLRGRSGRQGDPGESPVLPVAGRRPDADVQLRQGRATSWSGSRRRRTCRSSPRRSPGRSGPRRPRSSSRTSRSARTSSSTTTCSTGSARSSTASAARCWRAPTCTSRSAR